MLSAIIVPLAADDIPVWNVEGYDGNLVFVPATRLKHALNVLRRAGHWGDLTCVRTCQ